MKEHILDLIKQNALQLDKIKTLVNLDESEVEKIIDELTNEQRIFLNSHNKYEVLDEKYLVGTLEKTSKGTAYVIANGE